MKYSLRKGYILVVAPRLVYFLALPTGKAEAIRAIACFPFIFVRDMSVVQPQLINHELIHFRQEVELLLVGAAALYVCEYLYRRILKKLPAEEAYTNLSMEQEAYANQDNLNYLQERKPYAMFQYIGKTSRKV